MKEPEETKPEPGADEAPAEIPAVLELLPEAVETAGAPDPTIPPVIGSEIFTPTLTLKPDSLALPEPVLEAQTPLAVPAPLAAPAAEGAASSPTQLTPNQPGPATFTRSQVLSLAAASGVSSFLLAVIFILVFFGSINGGLHYVRPADFNQLDSQVQQLSGQTGLLDTRTNQIQKDVQDLDSRMAALETLAKQVTALQGQVTTLQTEVDSTASQVEKLDGQVQGLDQQVAGLTTRVDDLSKRSDLFQKFLDGLRELMKIVNP